MIGLLQTSEVLAGSPRYEFTRDGGTAVYEYLVADANLESFLTEVFPGASAGLPGVASLEPRFPWLVADKVEIEPFDKNNQGPGFPPVQPGKGFRVVLTYAAKPYDQTLVPSSDFPGGILPAFFSLRMRVAGEFVTYPSAALAWMEEDGETLDADVTEEVQAGVVIPQVEHDICWHYVNAPPWTTIRNSIGKVNNDTFLGAPAETVLFVGCEGERETTTAGLRSWSVNYHLVERNQGNNDADPFGRPLGWNHFLRPMGTTATFQRMKIKPSGANQPYRDIYDLVDLSQLFQPEFF